MSTSTALITTATPVLDVAGFHTETVAERERLVALLKSLTPEQWEAPSLCDGWRVREVVAHLGMPFRASAFDVVTGVLTSRFSFDRYADRLAREDTARFTPDELVESLRANITNPWRPPGGGISGALSHDLVHGLDVTVPLGLPGPPAERVGHVVRAFQPRHLKGFGADLTGLRLVATDTDVAVGSGPTEVPCPVQDLLLAVTGRAPVPTVR